MLKVHWETRKQMVGTNFTLFFHFVLLCWKELKFVLSILINLLSPEEDISDTVEDKLGSLALDASASLNDATPQQIEDEMQTENFTAVHESLGEGEGHYVTAFVFQVY